MRSGLNRSLPRIAIQPAERLQLLADDVFNRRLRRQSVIRQRDRDSMLQQRRRDPGKVRLVERTPVAAMNEDQKRRIAVVRVKNIEPLHIERAVLKIDLARAHPARRGALFSPARKDLRDDRESRRARCIHVQERRYRMPCTASLAVPAAWTTICPAYNIRSLAAGSMAGDISGEVAQLGERCVRNAEVGSSILLFSTISISQSMSMRQAVRGYAPSTCA